MAGNCVCRLVALLSRFRRLAEVMPTFSGSTLMIALIASSNVNGCRLTGLAFGIVFSEMASAIARRNPSEVWRICPAEDVASEASSASCYHLVEDVRVLPIIEPEGKLIEVQGQILAADLVVTANDATLEQAPEGFDIIGVNVAPDVTAIAVPDDFVRVICDLSIGRVLIGRQERFTSVLTVSLTKWSSVSRRVFPIALQTTFPLRLMAPMTGILLLASPPV